MVNKIYKPCSIIDEHRNKSYGGSYAEIVAIWRLTFDDFNQKFICPVVPKCKRAIYQMVVSTKYVSHSAKGSTLIIELQSPNVQTIVDSYSYDFQSLVGEIGGTLGLCLGLSMFSFVEFFEFAIRKIFINRT